MKIAWAHDHSLNEIPTGGAERTNHLIVQASPHQVEVLHPKNLVSQAQVKDCDLLITNNIKFFSCQQIEWMLEQPNRIRYEHDYWNIVDPNHKQYINSIWQGLGCIFLSPAHYYEYRRIHSMVNFKNVTFQPSPIDVDLFQPKDKKPLCIYIGAIEPHKGVYEAAQWAWSKKIKLVVYGITSNHGYLVKVINHPAVVYGGRIPYEMVVDVMCSADAFVHLPSWVEPYGRTAVEARLANCNLIYNNRLGVASYGWWEDDVIEIKERLREQPKKFWEKISEF